MSTQSIVGPEAQNRIAFSIRELAQQTGLSEPFLRLEIRRGNLRALKLGRRLVVLATDRDEWLERGTWVKATR